MRVCWKNLHTAIGCSILDIVCTSKWENVSLKNFEIDSLAFQKGRSTNQHPYTKPSKCEQWREERCGQTLQGMWMSMKPRTMLQDQMWMNMEKAKINDSAAIYQKWNTQHCSLHIQLYDHNPQPCTCDWRSGSFCILLNNPKTLKWCKDCCIQLEWRKLHICSCMQKKYLFSISFTAPFEIAIQPSLKLIVSSQVFCRFCLHYKTYESSHYITTTTKCFCVEVFSLNRSYHHLFLSFISTQCQCHAFSGRSTLPQHTFSIPIAFTCIQWQTTF